MAEKNVRDMLDDFVLDIREVCIQHDYDLLTPFNELSWNKYFPSTGGDVLIAMDDGNIAEIRSAIGSLSFGSHLVGNKAAMFLEIRDKYGLEEVSPMLPPDKCKFQISGPIYKVTKGLQTMADNYFELGPVPANEECEQLGNNYNEAKARKECIAYKHQLDRQFGTDCRFAVKSFAHEYGRYYEVVIRYTEDDESSEDIAFNVEQNLPLEWDEDARKELGL